LDGGFSVSIRQRSIIEEFNKLQRECRKKNADSLGTDQSLTNAVKTFARQRIVLAAGKLFVHDDIFQGVLTRNKIIALCHNCIEEIKELVNRLHDKEEDCHESLDINKILEFNEQLHTIMTNIQNDNIIVTALKFRKKLNKKWSENDDKQLKNYKSNNVKNIELFNNEVMQKIVKDNFKNHHNESEQKEDEPLLTPQQDIRERDLEDPILQLVRFQNDNPEQQLQQGIQTSLELRARINSAPLV